MYLKRNELYYTPTSIIDNTIYTQKYGYDEFFHFISVLVEKNVNPIPNESQTIEV